MRVLGFLALAYLLGSIPSSHLAGRLAGVELSREGSGNLGSTNVFRVLGWRYALPVILADMLKGFLPAWYFAGLDGSGRAELALIYGLAAVAGHVWSVYLGFRGGKGVATSGGVLLALAPLATVVGILIWSGTVFTTRTVSLASLVAATLVPVLAWVTRAPAETVAYATALAGLIWWTHRDNLLRLREGREMVFGGGRVSSLEMGEGKRARESWEEWEGEGGA